MSLTRVWLVWVWPLPDGWTGGGLERSVVPETGEDRDLQGREDRGPELDQQTFPRETRALIRTDPKYGREGTERALEAVSQGGHLDTLAQHLTNYHLLKLIESLSNISIYILKQVPSFVSRLGECCTAVLLWSSWNCGLSEFTWLSICMACCREDGCLYGTVLMFSTTVTKCFYFSTSTAEEAHG